VLAGFALALVAAPDPVLAQKRVGATVKVNIESRLSANLESGLTLEKAGARFIKVHFKDVSLPGDSRLVVTSRDGRYSHVITAADLANDGQAWAHALDTDAVVVRLQGAESGARFAIDRYGYGDAAAATETVHGADDRRDRECFPATYKYNAANSVGRMLFEDDSDGLLYVCTGSLVSHQNHFLTNNHCVDSESEVDSLDVRFNYEYTTCGGNVLKAFVTVGSAANDLIRTSAALDYTLLTLAGNPAATYGYLPINGEDLQQGDPLYLPQHPGGDPKKIHARHTGTAGEDCVVVLGDWNEPGYAAGASIRHTCDTEGGSSGSPVLNDNNQIVALHHTGYAAGTYNGAIEIENIYPQIVNDLPEDRGGSRTGALGWVWYRSRESWRYESGNSERIWNYLNGTTDTAWVDAKAQPTLATILEESSESGHWLGLFWTGATAWSNARLWFN
jgi:hypothetical protein